MAVRTAGGTVFMSKSGLPACRDAETTHHLSAKVGQLRKGSSEPGPVRPAGATEIEATRILVGRDLVSRPGRMTPRTRRLTHRRKWCRPTRLQVLGPDSGAVSAAVVVRC